MSEEKQGWFKRLKQGLTRTSSKITSGITNLFLGKKISAETLDELEDILLSADLGVGVTTELMKTLHKKRTTQDLPVTEVQRLLFEQITEMLKGYPQPLRIDAVPGPHVITVLGVNGVGKTTTTAKIAKYLQEQGLTVAMGACDTFRAAATEQLQEWADRLKCPLFKNENTTDAAAVAHEAYMGTKRLGYDVLLLDTAGRLHTKSHLMGELQKINRVLKKCDEAAPHHALLVVDATSGQNVLNQIKIFQETVPISGLVMTKLDGTSKGGILVQAAQTFQLPINFIGVGESAADLRPFSAEDYAKGLVGLE